MQLKRLILAANLSLAVSALPAFPRSEMVARPLLAGCHGDPSVCRVGDTYYMVTTSFAWWPGQPVYRSRDFRRWELAGHVAASESWKRYLLAQDDSYGLWAATIRHYDGLFHVVGTRLASAGSKHKHENYFTTAKDPAGPWSEPRIIEGAYGIDPDLFRDRDGKYYLILNGWYPHAEDEGNRCSITIAPFDPVKCAMTDKPRILTTGLTTKSRTAEGGDLFRLDDPDFGSRYLLICAEGGTGANHATAAFWSTRDLFGPYIPQPNNPVITRRNDKLGPLTGTGHSDLVTTPDGGWYAVFLGTRRYPEPYSGNTILGRECFGCKAEIRDRELVYDQTNLIEGEVVEPEGYIYEVPFEGAKVRRLKELEFAEETEVDVSDGRARGLVLYRKKCCNILFVKRPGELEAIQATWNGRKTLAKVPCVEKRLRLRLSVDFANVSFAYSKDGKAWTPVGRPVGHEAFRCGWEGTGVGIWEEPVSAGFAEKGSERVAQK